MNAKLALRVALGTVKRMNRARASHSWSMPAVVLVIAGLSPMLTGCRVIGGIFKAGMGVGIVFTLGVIGAIVGLGFALFGKKKS